jgi:hypothetical protein
MFEAGKVAGTRLGGRKKGVPNKITGQVKDMILQALTNVGGVTYLEARAVDSPTAFMALVGKVLPLQVAGDPDNPLQHAIKVTFE